MNAGAHEKKLIIEAVLKPIKLIDSGQRIGIVPRAGIHGGHVGRVRVVRLKVTARIVPERIRVAMCIEIYRPFLPTRYASQWAIANLPRQPFKPFVHPFGVIDLGAL